MVGELGEVGLGVTGIQGFEHFADLPVQAQAPARAQPVVERVTDEGVGEAQTARAGGHVGHDALPDRFVEELEDAVRRVLARPRKRLEVELAAEDRREYQQAIALVREVGESASDDVADVLRDGKPNLGAGGRRDPLEGEEAHDLADEERIPLGLLVQRRDELGRGDLRRCRLDVGRHVFLAQPAGRKASGHRLPSDLGQHRGQRLSGNRTDVTVGTEDQDARRAERAGNELKKQERGRVGGVQVVEDEHERPLRGGLPEKTGGGVEETKARRLRLGRDRRRQAGQQLM
jgi:hypothetical protein